MSHPLDLGLVLTIDQLLLGRGRDLRAGEPS